MDDIQRTEAASLLGKIGKLYTDPDVLDVRPVIEPGSHEMLGLRVTTHKGKFIVTIAAEDEPAI